MNRRSRQAAYLLRRCASHDDGWGVVYSGASAVFDGQAWINWRTARALERRGLVEAEWDLAAVAEESTSRLRLITRSEPAGRENQT